jgi:hypothetical protein
MANNRKAGQPGRFHKGDDALAIQIFARCTRAQKAAYLAAGGAGWLRAQLDAEIVRQRLAPTPTAHNPFPPARFTVTDAKTGEPVPHTVTVREF